MSTVAGSRLGAWPRPEGDVEFRLWAPAADHVELILDGQPVPMVQEGAGVFSTSAAAPSGTPYRFRIDGEAQVPDPAARWQPHNVEGASAVLPCDGYQWRCTEWQGRPWNEMVIYEVHVGCSGGYEGLRAQLPALAAMGITALELMPVAQFPGRRNWGYDGVFPYAPAEAYGHPDGLKALVDDAHAHGLAVVLDVVYNHFGPQGNLLSQYAPAFFHKGADTPWGDAIDFAQPQVQQFFIDNALMWLHEYRFDGLRLDAVHTIAPQTFLVTLLDAVRESIEPGRHVHLMLENERNQVHWLEAGYQAQWNDDYHNALHVLLSGETHGYYADYAGEGRAAALLARSLAEGFAWQGETNAAGQARGEPSASLPTACFINFAQNHDQVGNRALGERLAELVGAERAQLATSLTLLVPMVPLVFMGEPWQTRRPFLFFTDYTAPLDEQVREGRREEFAAFPAFDDPHSRERIPDPNDPETFAASVVTLPQADDASAQQALAMFETCLALRREHLQPVLMHARSLGSQVLGEQAVQAGWQLPAGQWWLAFNAGEATIRHHLPAGQVLLGGADTPTLAPGELRVHWVQA